jgi:hypothetical protein
MTAFVGPAGLEPATNGIDDLVALLRNFRMS